MDIYASDDEKGEAIKNWWRENGRSVVTGVVLGGAVIFGGRYWINFQHAKTEQAAAMYQQVQMNISDDDLTAAEDLTQELMQSHSSTPYAAFATLELAAEQARKDQPAAALEYLKWTADKAKLTGQKDLARDIYLAQESKAEAFEAYRNALSSMDEDDPRKTLLEMKRDDVAVINES